MKRIFVNGVGGFVGAHMFTQLSDRYELTGCHGDILRKVDGQAILREVECYTPNYIIHAAAMSDIASFIMTDHIRLMWHCRYVWQKQHII